MTRLQTATVAAAVIGAGTYAIRASFLALAHRATDLSPRVRTVLRMIPPSALAALVMPPLARPDGSIDLWSPEFLAGLIALAVAWRWRNMIVTIAVGMLAVIGLTAIF